MSAPQNAAAARTDFVADVECALNQARQRGLSMRDLGEILERWADRLRQQDCLLRPIH